MKTNSNTNKPASNKYEVYTEAIDKYIVEYDNTQSDLELLTSPGFIYMMSLMVVPTAIVALVILYVIKKK